MLNKFNILIMLLMFSNYINSSELLRLGQGSAKTIKVSPKIASVFISSPDIADYKVIDANNVVVHGKNIGSSAIIIYDRKGNEIYNNSIIVNINLDILREELKENFPEESVTITAIKDNVVLNGTVNSERKMIEIYNMVGKSLETDSESETLYIDSDGEGENNLYYTRKYHFEDVINNLKVISTNQINVKVTIAEVSSSFLSNLGVNYGSSVGGIGTFINPLLDFSAEDIVSIISLNANDSIGQILAAPNLTVFSGEQANFLVGGEIPIVIRDNDGYSISYKEYGIKLSMIAKVIDNENIRLTLTPEVSSLDETNQTSTGLITVPSLSTRRALTTVQLKDGQSFILAGLLSSEDTETLSKIPYLSDIPILGALFSNTQSITSKTELIIVATVNLVNPVSQDSVKLPKFQQTNDIERLLRIDFPDNSEPELINILSQGGFK